jgi:hypothetical protein
MSADCHGFCGIVPKLFLNKNATGMINHTGALFCYFINTIPKLDLCSRIALRPEGMRIADMYVEPL